MVQEPTLCWNSTFAWPLPCQKPHSAVAKEILYPNLGMGKEMLNLKEPKLFIPLLYLFAVPYGAYS